MESNSRLTQVLGWYNHANVGDESYKLAFPTVFPERQFIFDEKINNIHNELVVGGGDILTDYFLKKINQTNSDRKFIISASANDNTPCHLLKNFNKILVRDTYSVKFLEKNGIQSTYMPDIAFSLSPNPARGLELLKNLFHKNKLDFYEKRVGIVLNAYLASMGSDSVLARDFISLQKTTNDLAKIADNTSASFIFFPMCSSMPADDRITNSSVASKCKFWQKNLIIFDQLDVQDTLDMISSLDVVISTRLHSTIFSVISEIPFIDITHHDKNKRILETIGLNKYSFSYWEFQQTPVENLLKKMLQNPKPYKSKLREVHKIQREILKRESACVFSD